MRYCQSSPRATRGVAENGTNQPILSNGTQKPHIARSPQIAKTSMIKFPPRRLRDSRAYRRRPLDDALEVCVSLVAGTKLGACEIVSLLGAGGMGEVYRAPAYMSPEQARGKTVVSRRRFEELEQRVPVREQGVGRGPQRSSSALLVLEDSQRLFDTSHVLGDWIDGEVGNVTTLRQGRFSGEAARR